MKFLQNSVLLYLLLIITFIGLIALTARQYSSQAASSLSAGEYQLFILLIELPLILIWVAAFYSHKVLASYSRAITQSPEFAGFQGLAHGCRFLVWGLPIAAIITLFLSVIAHDRSNFISASTIITNYLALLIALIAFSVMNQGTRNLVKKYEEVGSFSLTNAVKQLALIAIGIAYSYLIIRNFEHESLVSASNQYALPVWLLITSLIIPYLYAWFLGLLTVSDIIFLAKRTPGVIYRKALRTLAGGLILVIISLIVSQYLKAWLPTQNISMAINIVSVYATYILSLAGFFLIAFGARKMQKMEEV